MYRTRFFQFWAGGSMVILNLPAGSLYWVSESSPVGGRCDCYLQHKYFLFNDPCSGFSLCTKHYLCINLLKTSSSYEKSILRIFCESFDLLPQGLKILIWVHWLLNWKLLESRLAQIKVFFKLFHKRISRIWSFITFRDWFNNQSAFSWCTQRESE